MLDGNASSDECLHAGAINRTGMGEGETTSSSTSRFGATEAHQRVDRDDFTLLDEQAAREVAGVTRGRRERGGRVARQLRTGAVQQGGLVELRLRLPDGPTGGRLGATGRR
ncbi:MAG TPA: hypothetical protein RMH99_16330 [Sandaracinaceae bacterium LLY-WYZ-13_1]|nr:hypothetical protein [Sandaracinaceae bacterium LLY-WYZ-13_1]